MPGASGPTVTLQTPPASLAIACVPTDSQITETFSALGARSRKVILPSAWTSGETRRPLGRGAAGGSLASGGADRAVQLPSKIVTNTPAMNPARLVCMVVPLKMMAALVRVD